eukprot:Skav220028  [mRNA]  locus=scaffold2981:115320:119186:+ [translate_table: standard]
MAKLKVVVNGVGGNICSILAEPSSSIRDVREAIHEATAIPPSQQRLLMGCRQLDESIQLVSLLNEGEQELSLTLVLRSLNQASETALPQICFEDVAGHEAKLLEAIASGEKLTSLLVGDPSGRRDSDHSGDVERPRHDPLVVPCSPSCELRKRPQKRGVIRMLMQWVQWVQWVQADEDVVLEAVKQNRFAFRFAAESLRTGGQEPQKEILQQGQSCQALQFAAPALQRDKELQACAMSMRQKFLGEKGPADAMEMGAW